jgi:hypothetical protein
LEDRVSGTPFSEKARQDPSETDDVVGWWDDIVGLGRVLSCFLRQRSAGDPILQARN